MESRTDGKSPRARDTLRGDEIVRHSVETRRGEDKEPRRNRCANRFQPVGNVYVLDLEYFSTAYLRPIQTETLSKTGDSDRSMILAEYTLEVKNEVSSGILSTVLSS